MATREELEAASAGLMRIGGYIDQAGVSNLFMLTQLMEHVRVLMSHAIHQCKRVGIDHITPTAFDHGKPIDLVCGLAAHSMQKKEYRKAIDALSVLTDRTLRILSLPIDSKTFHIVPQWVPPLKGK